MAHSVIIHIARFKSAHEPAVVETFMKRARLPTWDALEEQMKKGPPAFLRPGWTSPLLGKRVDMGWLDTDSFECIRPSKDGFVSPVSSMADPLFYGFQLVPRTY